MRLINADKRINLQFYDDMNEEWSVESMTIAECLDRYTEEGCPSADRPQEWIPCKERLPKEYEVLCCDIYKNCIVGHPFADDSASTGFSAESEGEFMYECVAWMPLPEPYKGA